MNVLWLIVIGLASGVVGGMGMGGGTLLVPLLTLLGLEQLTVQGINLVCFVPMCIVSLAIHSRQGRLKTGKVWWILVPAVISAGVGAYIAHHIQPDILTLLYGIMLVVVGGWQIVVAIKAMCCRSDITDNSSIDKQ